MKNLYKKFLFLNPWIQGMIFLVFFYLICSIMSYLSLGVTVDPFLKEGTSIYFNISTLRQTIFIPFIFIFSIMSQAIPCICGFILFGAYYWTFSKEVKRINIIPLSNKQLMLKVLKQWIVLFLVFFLIYLTFIASNAFNTLDIEEFIKSLKNLNIINFISFTINNSSALFSFLFTIIIDMQCKNSCLGKEATTFWCLLSFIFSISFFTISLSLFQELNLPQLAFPIFLIILIVIELTYILKTINNLKIN